MDEGGHRPESVSARAPHTFRADPTSVEVAKLTGVLCPLTRRARWRLFPPVHAFWFATRWFGLRDRLRCPYCNAVGTWKPHGTWSARIFSHDRSARRWLCKWCGMYEGHEGIVHAYPCGETHVWRLGPLLDLDSPASGVQLTPNEAMRGALGPVWPWRG